MDYTGRKVFHKAKYGYGEIVSHSPNGRIIVKFDFETELKLFLAPDCFRKFLELVEPEKEVVQEAVQLVFDSVDEPEKPPVVEQTEIEPPVQPVPTIVSETKILAPEPPKVIRVEKKPEPVVFQPPKPATPVAKSNTASGAKKKGKAEFAPGMRVIIRDEEWMIRKRKEQTWQKQLQ